MLSLSAIAFPLESHFCLFLFQGPSQDPKSHSVPVPIDFSLWVNSFSDLPCSYDLNKVEKDLSVTFYIIFYWGLILFSYLYWEYGSGRDRLQKGTASLCFQALKGKLLVLTVLTWLRQGLSGFSLGCFCFGMSTFSVIFWRKSRCMACIAGTGS